MKNKTNTIRVIHESELDLRNEELDKFYQELLNLIDEYTGKVSLKDTYFALSVAQQYIMKEFLEEEEDE